jgi:hypothetical protein
MSADVYEWQMERHRSLFSWQGRSSRSERRRYVDLQRQRPDFPSSPRTELPDAGTSAADLPKALAAILRHSVGKQSATPDSLSRWTASGGNLGSPEAYVVVPDGCFDLPSTVLRYDDMTDEVLAPFLGGISIAECLRDSGLSTDGVRSVVVLVGAVGRVRAKYGWFANRVIHLDAGCALVSLTAAAMAHGLTPVVAPAWRDDLAELLELRPGQEIVTAVVALIERRGH